MRTQQFSGVVALFLLMIAAPERAVDESPQQPATVDVIEVGDGAPGFPAKEIRSPLSAVAGDGGDLTLWDIGGARFGSRQDNGVADPRPPAPQAGERPSSDIGADDWGRIEHELSVREYRASPNSEGLQAPNRAHNLRTYFEPSGIRVLDRTALGAPTLLEMRLTGAGRGSELTAVGPGTVRSEGARVEIQRLGLVEWYENSAAGLEQGFTVAESPGGEGSLVVELAVEGAVVMGAAAAAPSLMFASETGRRLDYGKLVAYDATGLELPAHLEAGDHTVRIVVDDAAGSYPLTIDPLLTGMADAQLESNQATAGMGIRVAAVGDVNGDGYGDVIVGAFLYDLGQSDEGAAIVFLGSAGGIAHGHPGTAAATLQSNQAFARLGISVAGAGDVNGDGYDDVIVGTERYDAGETDEGAAFVFLGSAGGIANGDPGTAAATLQSNQAAAFMGASVAGVGDVNGDGYADVIVSATRYDLGETDEGAAFVFLGSIAGIANGHPGTAAATLQSNQINGGLDYNVARAGDVNADGYGDVIVGAPYYDLGESDEGAAFVFMGSAGGVASGHPGTAAATLQSNQMGAFFGGRVAGTGDVNGDGFADVIVGALVYDLGESNEGAAFVFMGSAGGIVSGDPGTAAATLQSNQADANFGYAAAGAGDVNGDGYADVIVGARLYDLGETNEGAAFVFVGSAAGIASGDPGTAAATLQSNQIGASMGTSVAGAGDVNGDGYADVIVGAWQYDNGENDEGAAFVFLGGATGIASGDPETAAATLQSNQADAGDFYSVAGAGDVNGDGYGDIIVGIPFYDLGESDEGAAFVFLGSTTGIASGDPGTAAATLQSNQAGARLGVAGAADVNGDGYSDVIVGAWQYDNGESDEGAAFVFLGSAGGIASGDPGTAAATLQSNQVSAIMGYSVAGAGDVNGDGYGDVIVGAWLYDLGESDEGAAFVFLGGAGGIASGHPGTAAATLQSNQAGAGLGFSVSGAGDVNGDGYGDVIVGATFYDASDVDEGAAFVFLGSSGGVASGHPGTAATTLTLRNSQHGASFGCSVAGAGDVNGDGYADVIVGAYQYDLAGIGTDGGAAFVYLGGAGGIVYGPGDLPATLRVNQNYAHLGYSVAGAGDVNGDGYADVIVGANSYSLGESAEGAAFVFLGSAAEVIEPPATLQSNQINAVMGSRVAGAADVNGDGFADVIVGAGFYDQDQSDEGAAFVFLGGGGRLGRPISTRQLRGGASDLPVQPWGLSYAPDRFKVRMNATDPAGRERVKLETEYCPPGKPFGSIDCGRHVTADWLDVGPTGATALMTEVVGATNTLYRWRTRVLYAPHSVTQPGITAAAKPAHGPWRRLFGQAVEGDIRTLAGPVAVESPDHPLLLAIEHLPSPAFGRIMVTFRLPDVGRAQVELFDVMGRRIVTRDVPAPHAGRHTVSIENAHELQPGIYMVRVTQSERRATARVALLQ